MLSFLAMHPRARHLLLALTLWSAFTKSSTALACEERVAAATFEQAAEEALDAFANGDGPVFDDAVDGLHGGLRCAATPFTPSQAAALHVAFALEAFGEGDDGVPVLHLQSALQAEPHLSLPPGVAPPGHPLRLSLEVARALGSGPTRELVLSTPGTARVDGLPASEVPFGRPVLVQRLDSEGRVEDTVLVGVDAPLPSWAQPPELDLADLAVTVDPVRVVQVSREPRAWVPVVAGTGLALVAGITYAALRGGSLDGPFESDDYNLGLSAGAAWAGVALTGAGAVTVLRW